MNIIYKSNFKALKTINISTHVVLHAIFQRQLCLKNISNKVPRNKIENLHI